MMIQQTRAHIFLRTNNEVSAHETSRTVSVFNPHTPVVGRLQAVQEETLAPGVSKKIKPSGRVSLLIPVVGDLSLMAHTGSRVLLCGQMALLDGSATASIRNGYNNALVKFLCLQFNIPGLPDREYPGFFSFDLDRKPPAGNPVFMTKELVVDIQKMGMRDEIIYEPRLNNAVVFCYLIQGSAEIAGRLLHNGDGLALWDTREFETESFGPETILLTVATIYNK